MNHSKEIAAFSYLLLLAFPLLNFHFASLTLPPTRIILHLSITVLHFMFFFFLKPVLVFLLFFINFFVLSSYISQGTQTPTYLDAFILFCFGFFHFIFNSPLFFVFLTPFLSLLF